MKFNDLQERLRVLLYARVTSGELTGSQLARQVGLRQAHVSNFLRRKRGLSVETMDNMLAGLRLSVLDLLEPNEINRRVTLVEAPSPGVFESVVLVSPETAARQEFITAEHVIDFQKFQKKFLRRLRADRVRRRAKWRRFVLFQVDEYSGSGMLPRLQTGAVVLIDRHYNSLRPYREGYRNMYAVLRSNTAVIRFVEVRDGQMLLIPLNPGYQTELIELPNGKMAEDYIIGRVAHVAIET